MRMKWLTFVACLWSLSTAGIASAQQAALTPAKLESAALELGSGEALWHDPQPTAGPVAIVVSLPLQVGYVYRAGTLIGVASVSTGKPGKETPTGTFEILQKKTFHRSNLYSNAPMPFMQRLTWDGIALHAGDNPGYPASHGCIRFPTAFAKKLYAATAMGGAVAITDDVAVAPPGVKVPRIVPPPASFSFGSEPVIASRPPAPAVAPARVAQRTPVTPAAPAGAGIGPRSTPPAEVQRVAQAAQEPRLVALGFEPVGR
ncbi:L,D-transpeptidase family protein [Sphingomonas japonica]|uniref:L,D-TPase catalytic domain-containing protein n=1 Tax=Sphingomonas japonica TaxID=511662 RepID=A0ABX0U6T0_9SPHN|nr:L,D-transpeptidase family protein [Sphingomonas japonica]NIJ24483.1 hypothetical protein [Sphingomonas japonica]